MRLLQIIRVVASCAALTCAAYGRQSGTPPQSSAATTQAPPASQTPARTPPPAQTPQTDATPRQPPPTAPNVTPGQPDSQAGQSTSQSPGQLGLDEVLRLANAQVSGLRQAELNERVAEEDVRQARAAFL
ncbi:MAG TPA: hypothetical protein VNZ44_16605, partial [Pyrinomonadaceae bacterium]|nr:hypothetical protein [Pyrinomonadaceae bacterium]